MLKVLNLCDRDRLICVHLCRCRVCVRACFALTRFLLFCFCILWQRRILDYTKYEMLNKALEAFGDLGDDEELGPVDWPTVKRYITCLNEVEGECVHPHSVSDDDDQLDSMNLKDIRLRLLNGKCLYISLFYTMPDSFSTGPTFPLCLWPNWKPHIDILRLYLLTMPD